MLKAVSGHAVEAALLVANRATEADAAVRGALERDLEAARYDAFPAGRRHELVDPAKRHVARELEARWNAALMRVAALERRIAGLRAEASTRPRVDREALLRLTYDLPAAWNAPTADARTRQRLVHTLIQEVVIDLGDAANEAVLVVHWAGGRHTEIRVARVKMGRYPADRTRCPVEAVRRLAPEWPDREVAVAPTACAAGRRTARPGQQCGSSNSASASDCPRATRRPAARRLSAQGGRRTVSASASAPSIGSSARGSCPPRR